MRIRTYLREGVDGWPQGSHADGLLPKDVERVPEGLQSALHGAEKIGDRDGRGVTDGWIRGGRRGRCPSRPTTRSTGIEAQGAESRRALQLQPVLLRACGGRGRMRARRGNGSLGHFGISGVLIARESG